MPAGVDTQNLGKAPSTNMLCSVPASIIKYALCRHLPEGRRGLALTAQKHNEDW